MDVYLKGRALLERSLRVQQEFSKSDWCWKDIVKIIYHTKWGLWCEMTQYQIQRGAFPRSGNVANDIEEFDERFRANLIPLQICDAITPKT